jgi:hypothetical protein
MDRNRPARKVEYKYRDFDDGVFSEEDIMVSSETPTPHKIQK